MKSSEFKLDSPALISDRRWLSWLFLHYRAKIFVWLTWMFHHVYW